MILQGTVTNAGNDLYAAAFGKNPNLTRAEIGSEFNPDITKLEEQTSVLSPIKEVPITENYSEENVTHVRVQLNNEGITQPTAFCQIGLYATLDGGGEILLFVAQVSGTVTIPAANPQYPTLVEDILIELAHGNSVNFTAVINLAAFVTVGMLENKLTQLAGGGIELSRNDIPASGVKLHYHIARDVTGKYILPDFTGGGGDVGINPNEPAGTYASVFRQDDGATADGMAQILTLPGQSGGEITPLAFKPI